MDRIAQWDPDSQRYYYVQPSTKTTQWDVPQPSSEASTPAQSLPPYSPPVDQHQQTVHQTTPDYQNPPPQDRGGPLGSLGGLAQGFLGGGGKHGHGSSGGTLGLASSLLGGGKHSSGHTPPASGLVGLAGGLLGGKKPHGGHSSGGAGGLMGMAGGLASGLLNSVILFSVSVISPK